MLVFAFRGMIGHENLECTDPHGRERRAPLLQAAGPYRKRAGEVEARIRQQMQWVVHLPTNTSAFVCTRHPASAEIAAERPVIGRNDSKKSARCTPAHFKGGACHEELACWWTLLDSNFQRRNFPVRIWFAFLSATFSWD
jgi:hypothetical protein